MSDDLLARADEALARLDALPELARDAAEQAMQAVVAVYAEGIGRLVDLIAEESPQLAQPLADDDLVSHLLLIHGMHPEPIEVRVARALEAVRPYLHGHGGEVELVAADSGVARLRLLGSCDGCPSSATTMREAVEEAVLAAAPEVEVVVAAGAAPAPASRRLIPVRAESGPASHSASATTQAAAR